MPRKTTILIVILAVITGILIFLAARSDLTQNLPPTATDSVSPTDVEPYAALSFSRQSIDVSSASATQTVDILIDTAGQPVAGAQIELAYDPTVLTNVKLIPASDPFFGPSAAVLINSVDPPQGRISYAVGISPDESEKTGSGSLVTLTFNVNRIASVATSPISFLTKSAVTTLSTQGSVLKTPEPLQIVLIQPTTTR